MPVFYNVACGCRNVLRCQLNFYLLYSAYFTSTDSDIYDVMLVFSIHSE